MALPNVGYALLGAIGGFFAVRMLRGAQGPKKGRIRRRLSAPLRAKRRALQRQRWDKYWEQMFLAPAPYKGLKTKAYRQGVRSARRKLKRIGRAPRLRAEAR